MQDINFAHASIGQARATTGILYKIHMLTEFLYARYLCSRDALGQARRATIGYLVYKLNLNAALTSKIVSTFYYEFINS